MRFRGSATPTRENVRGKGSQPVGGLDVREPRAARGHSCPAREPRRPHKQLVFLVVHEACVPGDERFQTLQSLELLQLFPPPRLPPTWLPGRGSWTLSVPSRTKPRVPGGVSRGQRPGSERAGRWT